MTIIPNQPFGHGDIHFTITLAKIIADGRPILWPIFPQFVEGFNRAFPDITFVDWRTLQIDYNNTNQYECIVENVGVCTILPFRFAGDLLKLPYRYVMKAKYLLYGLDWQIWKEQAMWVRDTSKEYDIAFDNYIGSKNPNILINNTFGSEGNLRINIPIKGVEMKITNGISLFDYSKLIEDATEIHTVSTSIIYLLEMLDLTAKEIHLYPRVPIETDFKNIDYLLQKHKYIPHA